MAIVLLAVATDTRAQNTFTVSATFTVAAQTKLTFSATTLAFPNSDPDTVPLIPASQNPVTVTATARFGSGQAILTVMASDDLRSGMNTIAISALKWTAGGPGFVGGMMSRTVAQTVATWNSSGRYAGTLMFTLDNSWNYAVGNYGTTLTYTLSTP
jgi:hypothetical protein